MTTAEMIEKIYNSVIGPGTQQLTALGTITGNGSYTVASAYRSYHIIAHPKTISISTNQYGNCRLTKTFNSASPTWSYNGSVITTSGSSWTICNDEGSIISGTIVWQIYMVK